MSNTRHIEWQGNQPRPYCSRTNHVNSRLNSSCPYCELEGLRRHGRLRLASGARAIVVVEVSAAAWESFGGVEAIDPSESANGRGEGVVGSSALVAHSQVPCGVVVAAVDRVPVGLLGSGAARRLE